MESAAHVSLAQVQGRALYVAPAHKKPDLRARGDASSSVISPMPGPAPPVYSHEPLPASPQWGMVPGAYPGEDDCLQTVHHSFRPAARQPSQASFSKSLIIQRIEGGNCV